MEDLVKFRKVVTMYGDVADFLIVYIQEAHPTDGWLIPNTVEIPTHKSVQDRLAAVRYMMELEPVNCPVVVDSESGAACEEYTALPERLFVVLDGKIVYHGAQGPFGYKMAELETWLSNWKTSL
ncbi:type I iodothyronine deiodinase [Hyalella azteca]|uniref:Iodothyronine deiodinase n=1 Tax=Hyalella azteca TaxID=294128 RepID=A0A8B7PKU2_HYAAZ|nr:type I iodothyronine deiodinase [Hyalella azteca]